jgi:hypothetical protein
LDISNKYSLVTSTMHVIIVAEDFIVKTLIIFLIDVKKAGVIFWKSLLSMVNNV